MFMIKISEYRKMKGLSQKEFAEELGISAGNLCEWEKGRIEPSISALVKMSELLEISVDELIGKENYIVSTRQNDKQELLLHYFNLLDDENQDNVLGILKTMTKK